MISSILAAQHLRVGSQNGLQSDAGLAGIFTLPYGRVSVRDHYHWRIDGAMYRVTRFTGARSCVRRSLW